MSDIGMFVRAMWNYDRNEASDESGIDCSDLPSVTQQHFKEECDINTIVRRFGLTGEIPGDFAMPQWGVSLEDLPADYKSAVDMVKAADSAFMELPGEVRARFVNDPQRLMDFLGDAGNRAEAEKLGLIPKPPEVTRDAVKAIDELAAKLVVPKAAA